MRDQKEKLNKPQRVVVYIPEEDYRQLRAKLILVGLTVSEWMRRKIKAFLSD